MLNLFYRNFRLLIIAICLIVVWGISSFSILPRMEDPEISPRWSLINTQFPGASAYRVDSLVTEKIEQAIFEIEEINTIISTSTIGNSSIVVRLKPEANNVDEVWSKLRDKLADVVSQLPAGASPPEQEELLSKAYTLIAALTWELDSSPNYAILSRMAEELENELRTLEGTEKVELSGNPKEEIVVNINPSYLGITHLNLLGNILRS